MLRRPLLLVLLILFTYAVPAPAQQASRFSVAAGALVGPTPEGSHASIAASLPTALTSMRVRFEALLSQSVAHRDLSSATASLVYDPSSNLRMPYGIAGAGLSTNAGLALTGGLGWHLPAQIALSNSANRLPLFAEARIHYVNGNGGFSVGAGVEF